MSSTVFSRNLLILGGIYAPLNIDKDSTVPLLVTAPNSVIDFTTKCSVTYSMQHVLVVLLRLQIPLLHNPVCKINYLCC